MAVAPEQAMSIWREQEHEEEKKRPEREATRAGGRRQKREREMKHVYKPRELLISCKKKVLRRRFCF